MEPVAGTRTVRRTVRVAVALLLGQAVLVAVIGWVTYRYSPAHRHRDPAAVDQMAGAPRVLPRPPVRSSSAVVRPSETSARARSLRTTGRPVSRVRVPRSTPRRSFSAPPISALPDTSSPSASPSSPPPDRPAPPPDQPAPPPDQPTPPPSPPAPTVSPARPPGSPTPSDVLLPTGPAQQSVTVGALCDLEGAVGRTTGGADVRCVRGPSHQLSWKIV